LRASSDGGCGGVNKVVEGDVAESCGCSVSEVVFSASGDDEASAIDTVDADPEGSDSVSMSECANVNFVV